METEKSLENERRPALFKGGPGAVFYVMFCTALLFYFISESMLRQAAVSSVDPDEISLDAIIAKLPPGLQDSVTYNLELARRKEDLQALTKPEDTLRALNSLANFVRDQGEKRRIYAEILDQYPNEPGAALAYRRFLLAEDDPKSISIEEYHRFIKRCPPLKRPSLWNAGIRKLGELKATDETIVEFLSPLLSAAPDFRDYHDLYGALMDAAKNINRGDLVESARGPRDKCVKLKSVESVLVERAKSKRPKGRKKKAARKNKGRRNAGERKTQKRKGPASEMTKEASPDSKKNGK